MCLSSSNPIRGGERTPLVQRPAGLRQKDVPSPAAAMALASYGVDVDPGRLNKFLTTLPGGYTPQGWIYWEKAAEFDSGFTSRLSAPLRGFALLFPD